MYIFIFKIKFWKIKKKFQFYYLYDFCFNFKSKIKFAYMAFFSNNQIRIINLHFSEFQLVSTNFFSVIIKISF